MKKITLSIIIAVAALFAGGNVEAGQCYRPSYNKCHVYKVHTCEINRCYHWKTGYDHCGHSYRYRVVVVTYKTTYSNGTYNTYTKTFRA